MREKNLSKQTAKVVAGTLNKMLKVDANSTSCLVVYQPKAPKGLGVLWGYRLRAY